MTRPGWRSQSAVRASMAGALIAVLLMALSACKDTDSEADDTFSEDDVDAYFASCPAVAVFDRHVDLVADKEAFRAPEAAVLSVAEKGTEVVDVRTSGGSSEVEVRLDDDSGTFFVQHRRAGWIVKGGEGCAAWPAARQIAGPDGSEWPEGFSEQVQVESADPR
jgi:hypothetical protein